MTNRHKGQLVMFFGGLCVLGAVVAVVGGILGDHSVPHVIANGVGLPVAAVAIFVGYLLYRAPDRQK